MTDAETPATLAKSPSPGPPPLFVETTAHIDLALGDQAVRESLQAMLATHETWSSGYVLMEFRRTAVHAIKVARHLVAAAPSDHGLYPWLLRAIDRGQSGEGSRLTPRQRQRSRFVVYSVMEQLDGIPASRRLVMGWLDTTIQLVETVAWAGIDRMVDETDCDLIRPQRLQGRRWPLSCNARQAQCRQSVFLERHRPRLESALAACAADPEFDDTRALEVLRAILNTTPIHATGERRCWPVGDLILALEALPAARLLSSNRRHFGPICQGLGVTLVTYSPYPDHQSGSR